MFYKYFYMLFMNDERYALPTRNILSLKEQIWNISNLPQSEKPDCTLYEVFISNLSNLSILLYLKVN